MRQYLDPIIKADRCAQYMDDIDIAGKIADEFIENVEAVFHRVRETSLKLSMSKSQFGVQEFEFLGRTIRPKRISPINEKVKKFLNDLSMPSNIKRALNIYQIREFL